MSDAFSAASCIVLILAIGAVGANVVVGEYGTGLIRTTFVAVPARRSVMAAKVLVVAAVTTVFGALVAAASFGLTQAILSAGDAGLSIGDPGALRAVTASALLAPVAALTGMAIGVVIRHSVTTMVTFVLVFILIPLGLGDNRYLTAVVSHATPYYSWLRLTIEGSFGPVRYPWTTTGAWTVYAVWALVAAALTVITVHRRDQ
jgi:ABC-2 type transport system permease protein